MSKKKYKKEVTNENIFSAAKKFTDAFFDGLKGGMEDRIIKKAEQAGIERRAIEKMKQIKREKAELERMLSDLD